VDDYKFLNIPESCFVGSPIYKKLFYENAKLSSRDKTSIYRCHKQGGLALLPQT
jgi:hypothetical protein